MAQLHRRGPMLPSCSLGAVRRDASLQVTSTLAHLITADVALAFATLEVNSESVCGSGEGINGVSARCLVDFHQACLEGEGGFEVEDRG